MGGYYHLLYDSIVYYIYFSKFAQAICAFCYGEISVHKIIAGVQTTITNYKEERYFEQDIQRIECYSPDSYNNRRTQLVVDRRVRFQPGKLDNIRTGLVGKNTVYTGRYFRYIYVGVVVCLTFSDDCRLRRKIQSAYLRMQYYRTHSQVMVCVTMPLKRNVTAEGFYRTRRMFCRNSPVGKCGFLQNVQ